MILTILQSFWIQLITISPNVLQGQNGVMRQNRKYLRNKFLQYAHRYTENQPLYLLTQGQNITGKKIFGIDTASNRIGVFLINPIAAPFVEPVETLSPFTKNPLKKTASDFINGVMIEGNATVLALLILGLYSGL